MRTSLPIYTIYITYIRGVTFLFNVTNTQTRYILLMLNIQVNKILLSGRKKNLLDSLIQSNILENSILWLFQEAYAVKIK